MTTKMLLILVAVVAATLSPTLAAANYSTTTTLMSCESIEDRRLQCNEDRYEARQLNETQLGAEWESYGQRNDTMDKNYCCLVLELLQCFDEANMANATCLAPDTIEWAREKRSQLNGDSMVGDRTEPICKQHTRSECILAGPMTTGTIVGIVIIVFALAGIVGWLVVCFGKRTGSKSPRPPKEKSLVAKAPSKGS